MWIIEPSVEILNPPDGKEVLRRIEKAGRVCYKSEDKITDHSAASFVENIIQLGHESVLEHVSLSVRFIVDRGISHEIVRHRLASYSQESTRYCNYSKEKFGWGITVIRPSTLEKDENDPAYLTWKMTCECAEYGYLCLLRVGRTPQEARSMLPTCLKTELIMTANLREWRHFLRQRCSKAAHPDMRRVAYMLLDELYDTIPVVFDDIKEERKDDSR